MELSAPMGKTETLTDSRGKRLRRRVTKHRGQGEGWLDEPCSSAVCWMCTTFGTPGRPHECQQPIAAMFARKRSQMTREAATGDSVYHDMGINHEPILDNPEPGPIETE